MRHLPMRFHLLRRLLFLALFASVAFSGPVAAFDPFVVRDIRVEGAQRIDAGTVFGYLPVKVGDRFAPDTATTAIQALFATGFFRDVKLQADGDVLVVVVEERPAIGSVTITGTKEFDEDNLKRALRDLGLAESRIFDRSLLDRAEQELKRQYLSRGKYAVRITSTVTPLERNRVGITLAVEEGATASISAIRFVGNQAFSEKTLLDEMKLSTGTWLTWYTKADRYSREKLTGDLESLRSFYLDRGYLEFNVRSTQVSISPDRESIELVIVVEEGERFQVSDITFGGELLGREAEFRAMLRLSPGDIFSGSKLTDSTKRMSERLGSLGYAFSQVNAVPQADREKREVSFTVMVEPGRRAYVRRIDIAGNSRTRDEVIRRELRQFEDAWYDADKIKISKDRINRLGYFTDVKVETQAVPEAPDQVDLKVILVEKPTGAISVGIGFSSTEKGIFAASINQANFLGTGKTVGIDVNTSRLIRTVALGYTDPFFTDDGISQTVELVSRRFNAAELLLGDYILQTQSIGLRYGIPYTEVDRVLVGVAAESNSLRLGPLAPQRFLNWVDEYGELSHSVLGSIGWVRDSRDSALAPTAGRLQRLNFETTLPAGDLRYWRTNALQQLYWPITREYTLALNGDVSYGRGFGGRSYPLFKNYYAGGIGTVRGFYASSLGPSEQEMLRSGIVREVPIGGQIRVVGSAELLFPLPGSGSDRSIRTFVFTDVGNVFADAQFEFRELRVAAGVGVNWLSPIGPMKLSLGWPIRSQPTDRLQKFQFQVGSGF
jgi:outer membrane protein insertion porin family